MMRQAALVMVVLLAALADLAGCSAQQSGQELSRQVSYKLRTIAGYMVPEDARGVTAIGNGVLTEISPVWYQPAENGLVVFASRQAQQAATGIENEPLSRHVALVPSISNYRDGEWDGQLIHRIITNPQVRESHIAALVGLATSHQWTGVDIDYESLTATDRSAYSAFISDLAAALHQARKQLAVTVHAKTEEPGDWDGARAQDWHALGASADEIRVMAYDYSTEESPPGAIAPLPWVESVLRLAVSEVPREKLLLGVATYGYDWMRGQQGQGLQWTDVQAIAQAHAATVMWDATSQSPWFTYTDNQGRPRTVWYENARSLQFKINLVVSYHVNGIVIWRLGGEDPAIWEELRQEI